MNNLSQRLAALMQDDSVPMSDAWGKLFDDLKQADCDLCELLALREAGKTPIGSFHITDQEVEATTDYVKSGEWPIDNGELLVYAAPQLPAVPDEVTAADCPAFIKYDTTKVDDAWSRGCNECREAMIDAAPQQEES